VNGPAATAQLLAEVFPHSHIANVDYLRWLYEESPFGPVVESNLDDDRGRVGHYALVPIALARDGVDYPAALSLNTAVHERGRGGGVFVELGERTVAKAAEMGLESVVGVANANSTPGFVRRLGFELLTPLPARMVTPLPGTSAGIHSAEVRYGSGGWELGPEDDAVLSVPRRGEARRWTAQTLAWRLRRPRAGYAVHRGPGLLAFTCLERRAGLRIAVLLKVFAAAPLSGGECRALVRAACRHHRAPFALHAGLNDLVDFGGIAVPRRLRTSPLNLIYRSLVTPPREASIVRFEFLDFDAY